MGLAILKAHSKRRNGLTGDLTRAWESIEAGSVAEAANWPP